MNPYVLSTYILVDSLLIYQNASDNSGWRGGSALPEKLTYTGLVKQSSLPAVFVVSENSNKPLFQDFIPEGISIL
jgi:hypothetical protein